MKLDSLTHALLSTKPGILQKLFVGVMIARPQKSELYIQYYLTMSHDAIDDIYLDRFQKLLLSDYGLYDPNALVSDFGKNQMLVLPELAILNRPEFAAVSAENPTYTTDEYRRDNWRKLRAERQRLLWEPAFWCVRQNDLPGLERVVAQAGDFDFDMRTDTWPDRPTLIAVAACYSSFECFRFLLVNGARIDMHFPNNAYFQLSPFACACFGGNEEIIQIFLEANVDTSGGFGAAVRAGRNDVAEWLLRTHPDDIFSYCLYGCPFEDGVVTYNLKGLECLLDSGWDVEFRDGYEWTQLDYAVRDNNEAIVFTLLEHGASVALTDKAIESAETYSWLLDYGVSCGNDALSSALAEDNVESTILAMSIGQGLGHPQDVNRESRAGLAYLLMHPS